MSYPITAIEDIDADEVEALKSVGIRTTEKLLEAAKSPKGRKLLAAKTEVITGGDGGYLLVSPCQPGGRAGQQPCGVA